VAKQKRRLTTPVFYSFFLNSKLEPKFFLGSSPWELLQSLPAASLFFLFSGFCNAHAAEKASAD